MTDVFSPPRVLVSVRNIRDVALSFFEKHRLQDNLDRFGDDWVAEYCTRESAGMVDYIASLESRGIPYRIVRYEDFLSSQDLRSQVEAFTGWPGGGDTSANLRDFDRGFEAERHGSGIADAASLPRERGLDASLTRAASEIAERCGKYQSRFGYAPS